MLSITQGTQSVQFSYDDGERLGAVTFPSGMVASYTYDPGSRLAAITYTLNQTTIGNLTYSYDALNHRVAVGGTLAGTVLPSGLPAHYWKRYIKQESMSFIIFQCRNFEESINSEGNKFL